MTSNSTPATWTEVLLFDQGWPWVRLWGYLLLG